MKPPAAARFLLGLFLPARDRETIPSDLEEEMESTVLPAGGEAAARRWYWSQVIRSLRHLAALQWRETPLLRLVGAVFAGYVVVAAPVIALDMAFTRISPETANDPGSAYIAANLVIGFLAVTAAGFVSAWIGRAAPLLHVLAFLGFCTLMAVAHVIENAGKEPAWYTVTLFASLPSGALLGGCLKAMQLEEGR